MLMLLRTVIYKLPGIRQIRDNVSAGTLRLRLSGLKSRAHLIRKYSFPSCQAQSSLHALSRLYVQKGFFALSGIHSALWPTNTSGDRPLCVGPTPVSKGFANFKYFSFSVLRQGVQAAHSVLHQRRHWMSAGDIWPDQSDVPAMRPFRFLNSVIHSQRRRCSMCHCLKHVWVQRPFHEQKITNQYEPREQTFCLTSVCVLSIMHLPCFAGDKPFRSMPCAIRPFFKTSGVSLEAVACGIAKAKLWWKRRSGKEKRSLDPLWETEAWCPPWARCCIPNRKYMCLCVVYSPFSAKFYPQWATTI